MRRVEDVLNKGDEINVRVVEVDRERGRIGLRLTDDPDIAGKSVEELAGVGTGGAGGGRAPREGAARNGRERSGRGPRREGERGSGALASRARPRLNSEGLMPEEHRTTTLDSGVRVVTERVPSVRSVALGFWIATGSAAEADEPGGDLPPARAHAVPGHRPLRVGGDRPDLRRDGG